ncbi:hypothetical protein [Alkanindiges illinoisensis]|nr:hypothetical protein [Alkanindiges illinoisensis]
MAGMANAHEVYILPLSDLPEGKQALTPDNKGLALKFSQHPHQVK